MPTVPVNGTWVHYFDDAGPDADAPAVVLLHGFARNGTFWSGWVPVLTTRYRVIRPDIRGCGRNPDPGPGFVLRTDDMVADLVGLLDLLHLSSVRFVGESTGGIVGALTAARHPDRIGGLVLCSTPVTPVNSDPRVKAPGAATPEESLRTLGLAQWWMRSRALTNDLFGDERDEAIAAEFARTPLHVALEMWRAMHQSEVTLEPVLGQVTAPTLLMTPTGSSTMGAEDQSRLAAALPHAAQRVYEGAPHGMYYLHAERLAADALGFFSKS
jgi:pimeloyl-ACP methyl ester carboxylesterase